MLPSWWSASVMEAARGALTAAVLAAMLVLYTTIWLPERVGCRMDAGNRSFIGCLLLRH